MLHDAYRAGVKTAFQQYSMPAPPAFGAPSSRSDRSSRDRPGHMQMSGGFDRSPLERQAMLTVLSQAMTSEVDPMRRRRLLELGRNELGAFSMPLMKNLVG